MIKKTIYVGFDGTLCVNKGIYPGAPIKPMVGRVKRWIQDGHTVKIFTARVDQETFQAERVNVLIITDWCEREGLVNLDGSALVITNRKGRDCDEIWDDRAVSVNEYGNYTSMHKTAAALDATVEDTVKSATALRASQESLGNTSLPGWLAATNEVDPPQDTPPPAGNPCYCLDSLNVVCDMHRNDPPDPRTR